ncbi:glycosyl hydrolase-related protein [Streptomyces sp. NBC_00264]|uniref:alpha-mannosidase n=1 Tax=unclassified Streptomyces TaxID=2593676 RepID=UPI000F5BA873|nr:MULTISPECIES: glycoside hydrolase family 38 C-terminal domain-containing protein [unclassified Streptomyces]WSG48643.1 glycosyl hydrolase-related protein [Streptomyces sp. NBC_01732]WSW99292.1 glycosyl hydrolase-related protein [Streptomyces sp. NBC_00987]MCX4399259.1 glycosyl hydrolase-related protein [Streptomyces sp. NBC_01767]MCX5157746.1 glycosyl hydrolase-related protein [Streptomyces sp. NBC_00305]MCX5165482.1 glycosyl hydrolase-related protein [Streptomyces sp. NBC_00305]
MHSKRRLTEQRLDRVLNQRIRPAAHARTVPVEIAIWSVQGEPVPVADGLAAPYEPVTLGHRWGPPWSTSWFRISGRVPQEWAGLSVEAVIDLGFNVTGAGFSAEGLVYRADGSVVKALNPRNAYIPVADPAAGGEEFTYYVEAAANPNLNDDHIPSRTGEQPSWMTGAGSESAPLYQLLRLELAVFDAQVWELAQDLDVLGELMRELPEADPRRWQLLHTIERALDAVDLQNIADSATAAREVLRPAFAAPAAASAHRMSAIGHAHIDTAWLWPLRETIRKVARTLSNVTHLMDEHQGFLFAMSQAQQLAWLKEHRPEVYGRVQEKAEKGQFLPVGSLWVEPDTNITGGEALVRQLIHGKRFYLDEFGVETEEMWLPDTFGYNAAMPQLMKLAGIRWFLTQKISWNTTNKFPHHTFWWEGIDGTRIFSHFPPVDTYNAEITGAELAHAVGNFQDKEAANSSLLPFGYGDGGGGPTREMLARAERLVDLEGSARVVIESPADFFERAHAEYPDAPVWQGELYLEFHRGTLTSQLRTKQGNRRSEHLLREAELWSATATLRTGFAYPYQALDRLWKTVLLHQFHDILPGSSIAWVHREAEQTYAAVTADLRAITDAAQRALAGEGDLPVVFNAAPFARDGVPALGATLRTRPSGRPVVPVPCGDGFALDNGLVRIRIGAQGLVTSAYDIAAEREALAPGAAANLLQLHQDFPNEYDAWDIDAFYRNTVHNLLDADSVEAEEAGVRIVRTFGDSRIEQLVSLSEGSRRLDIDTEIDWHEKEKLLKASFPLDVRADHSSAEIPFGHVRRPTHANTSWDAAKFEICAHRFLHLGERGWGAAVVNDSTYGHEVTRDVRADGGTTTTTVRLSLLRAPRFPDPDADQGHHHLRYGFVIGADIADAVREGYAFNQPERSLLGSAEVEPLVTADNETVVIEVVKLADDRSGDVVVRLYEAFGGRARTVLTAGFPLASAAETDLLEREPDPRGNTDVVQADGQRVHLALRPFQILTLRLRPRKRD